MNVPEEWTVGTVHANGVDLQYYRTGEGPPLVLAHGFYDNGRCWERLMADLADDYDVVAYDARGHGRSDAPETGYGIDDRVADLLGLLDALDLTDPILLGHSMGGATVGWAAAEHPDLPRAVVLEDPAALSGEPPMGPDERAEAVREALAEDAETTIEERIEAQYDGFAPEQARRHAIADTELDPNIAEIARTGYPENLSDRLGDITAPTLLLRRDADTEQRVEDLHIATDWQNGRLVHVPDADHCVFHTQYDAAFAELEAFLAWVGHEESNEHESRN